MIDTKHLSMPWLLATIFLAFVPFTLLCLALGYQVLSLPVKQIGQNMLGASAEMNTVLAHGQVVVDKAGVALDVVNRPCETRDSNGAHLPCGTLADFNRTMNTSRLTIGVLETAAKQETHNLDVFDSQERVLFNDAHKFLLSTNSTAQAATTVLNDSSLAITRTQPQVEAVLSHTQSTISNFNTIATNPAIPETLQHVDGVTANGERISAVWAEKSQEVAHCSIFKMFFSHCTK